MSSSIPEPKVHEIVETVTSPESTQSKTGGSVIPTEPAVSTPKAPIKKKKKIAVPPPGHKFVKVHDHEGNIRTVIRPLSVEELAAQAATKPTEPAKPATKKAAKPAAAVETVKTSTEKTEKDASDENHAAKNLTVKQTLDKESTAGAIADEASGPTEEDLDAQKLRFREGRLKKLKTALSRGLFTVAGAALPGMDVDAFQDGDEFVDHEDDPSDLENDEYDFHHDGQDDWDGHDVSEDHDHPDGSHGDAAAIAAAGAMAAAYAEKKDAGPAANGTNDKSKSTFKMTVKDLDKLEAQLLADEKPLKRHWASATFYLLGSLAVILPALFLGKSRSEIIPCSNVKSSFDIYTRDGRKAHEFKLEEASRSDKGGSSSVAHCFRCGCRSRYANGQTLLPC
jgi:hypothetical protein